MNDASRLIAQLESLHERADRGALASLRRGLGQPPGRVIEVSRIVERMLTEADPPRLRDTLYVVAPLFAFHPDGGRSGDMGAHFRALVEPGADPPPNVERRFVALLSSEPDDLPDALRQAVSLLKAKPVAVNWRQLFADVEDWLRQDEPGDRSRQDVRLRWARNFWRLSPAASAAPTAAPTQLTT